MCKIGKDYYNIALSFYRPGRTEEQETKRCNVNDTKESMTPYYNYKAHDKDPSHEIASLELLPNRRINAKRRARRFINTNSTLFFVILYLLIDMPSTYQQRKYILPSRYFIYHNPIFTNRN